MRLEFPTEQVKLWRVKEFGNLELLHATFVTRRFPRHFHEEFGFGVVEQGAFVYRVDGTDHVIPQGHLVIINPGDVHSGHTAIETGWTYRILYPDCDLLKQVMFEVTERQETIPYFSKPTVCDRPLADLLARLHMTLEATSFRLQQESIWWRL